MQIYIFSQQNFFNSTGLTEDDMRSIFYGVAQDTDTNDLVLSCYFIPGTKWVGGTAFVRQWCSKKQFMTSRGKWRFTRQFSLPNDLPERFKLIRLLPTSASCLNKFPCKIQDVYGWTFSYASLRDYLALLFAHELHHFRRYHLQLHPREGENGANRWALAHVQRLGFPVDGQQVRRSRRPRRAMSFLKKLGHDPFVDFRHLKSGHSVFVKHDPRGIYAGKEARVLRPIRANSRRIAIQTPDSREWLWPMTWLEPVSELKK